MGVRLDDPRIGGSVILDDPSSLGSSAIECSSASITWTGNQATVSQTFAISAGTASVSWSGLSVSLATPINVSVTRRSVAWRGYTSTLSLSNPNLFDPEATATVVSLSDPEPTPIS